MLSHLRFQELLQAGAQHLPQETIVIKQCLMQQTSKSFIIRNSHRSLLRQRGCNPLPILEERWPFRLHRQILTHHEFTDDLGRRPPGRLRMLRTRTFVAQHRALLLASLGADSWRAAGACCWTADRLSHWCGWYWRRDDCSAAGAARRLRRSS